MGITKMLYDAINAVRYAGIYLVLAPFLAFGVLMAILIISFAKVMEGVEILFGGVNLGSEFVKSVGIKALPSFYPEQF